KVGKGRRRSFANGSAGRFTLVLCFRHFHIQVRRFYLIRSGGSGRGPRSVSPTRGPCMRILPSGPLESSVGSTLASWKQPLWLRARSATARTTTADLFTWYSPRRGWFTSLADSDGPPARKRTANA